ncbi:iron complex transport system substrate-binding protein [Roseinatronobacter thiooxidans]|uniref:Iron complex transport system substrate-binding protein n=1 Tax=Roseinatronobacter thiooxidans TaxID=121821 RepID=A0A2W7QEH3_9RHOB|nr:ABC transporter substrate-binding protein [Roseinatronobacter thiooxidans]PZX39549.1 iron complex transport system substrate-binding protein [Roseinatronobacter thiooxidans]
MKSLPLALLATAFAAPALAYPVTVQSCDREVTFDAAPARAGSHDVNLTEMMLVLGLTDRMVGYTGISGWNRLDDDIRAGVAELPELAERYPSREVLIGADLDFWFAGWNYGMRVGGEVTPDTLAPFGIQVYELTESCIHIMPRDAVTIDDMYTDIRNLGRIFGVEARAEELISGWETDLAQITATIPDAEPVRVFVYDSGEDTPFTAGRLAMPTAMIQAAGGRNIMDDVDASWTRVAWEPVVERNPELVIIVNYGDVTAEQKIAFMKSNPAFAAMDAVRNDRFVVLDYVEATPGPRNIRAIATLAEAFRAR